MEKKEVSNKAIILLSGGIDSTVLAYYLKKRKYKLTALTFDYGQKHKREIQYAMLTSALLDIPLFVLDIKEVFENFSSFLTNGTKETVIVPNRNMIFLSIAVGFAENKKINKVFYAAHKTDSPVFPDCRPEFVKTLSKACQLGTTQKVEIIAPFINLTKTDIIKIGRELKVPFENTYSCYVGNEKPCGKCLACKERLRAFKENNLKDPLEYENSN